MASTMVEIMPLSDHILMKVDDSQHAAVDDLCMSVQSISLTGNSVEKVIEQITKDREKVREVGTADEDETRRIEKQLQEHDGKLDIGQTVVTPVSNQTEETFMSCSEKADDAESKEEAAVSRDLRTRNSEDKDELCFENGDGIGSETDGVVSPGKHQCIPQEHDETDGEVVGKKQETDETGELVAHGPHPPGIPIYPSCDPAVLQSVCFQPQGNTPYGGGYETAPKFRKPPPGYFPPSTYEAVQGIPVNPFLSGGDVFTLVGSPAVGLVDNDILTDFFQQPPPDPSLVPSGDFSNIMNSVHDDDISEIMQMPPNTYPGIQFPGAPSALSPARSAVSLEFDYGSDCISPGSVRASENPTMSPGSTADSGLGEGVDDELNDLNDVINKDLNKDYISVDRINGGFLPSDDYQYSKIYHFLCSEENPIGNPHVRNSNPGNPVDSNPRLRIPSGGNPYVPNVSSVWNTCIPNPVQNPAPEMAVQKNTVPMSTVFQLVPSDTASSVITTTGPVTQDQVPVTCFLLSSVSTQPVQAIATPRKPGPREILPKPPDFQNKSCGTQLSTSTAAGPRSRPPFIPEPEPVSIAAAVDNAKKTKIFRYVSGLTTDSIIRQDDDGDTTLHLMVAHHDETVVDALIRRLERDGVLHDALHICNLQHQTPLCLAVIANSPTLVRRLIGVGSNVNVQLQRLQLNNMGTLCYRLIHCIARKGLKWSQTLDELLAAPDIEVDVADSQGCSALHCAIDAHDRLIHEAKIDSRRTIYQLINRGADITVKHSLNGKTPLHFVVEKKNADFLAWFLDLVRYFAERQVASSLENPVVSPGVIPGVNPGVTVAGVVRRTVNAPASNGATALHIAASLKMEVSSAYERTRILQLLLRHGAEFCARSDFKLRTELAKDPALTELVKNAPTNPHRT